VHLLPVVAQAHGRGLRLDDFEQLLVRHTPLRRFVGWNFLSDAAPASSARQNHLAERLDSARSKAPVNG
jgi:hypothetical protein